jgi:hypothetical protein
VPTEETIEMFTLLDVFVKEGVQPTVTAAVGPRVAAFGTPEAFDGAGAVALYAWHADQAGWAYVGFATGGPTGSSHDVRGLGSSLVVAGDAVIAGARGDDVSPGRVVILKPPHGVWAYGAIPEQAVLTAPNPARGDGFGTSVACCSDGTEWYVAVGSPNTEAPRGPYGQGAAFVYRGLGSSATPWSGTWASNPQEGAKGSDRFGASVAINPGLGDDGAPDGTVVLAVGAPGAKDGQGAVYVGHTTAPGEWPGRWQFSQVIEPKFPDFIDEDFRTADFGTSVALAGGITLAVGSPSDPNFELEIEGTGAVWIYSRSGREFVLVQEGGSLYGPEADARFGSAVAFPPTLLDGSGPAAEDLSLLVAAPGLRQAFLHATEDGQSFRVREVYSCFGGKNGDGFGQAIGITLVGADPWSVVGAPGRRAESISGGGYLYAEGGAAMGWLDPPDLVEDPHLRWMGLGMDVIKRYTPQNETYYS